MARIDKGGYDVESGYRKLLGFRVVEWDHDHAVVELDIEAQHLNRSNIVHGGVLASLIDAACAFPGLYCDTPGNVRKSVTLSLTTSFTGQASCGVIRAVGKRRAGGRRIYFSTAEITNDQGEMIAFGEAVNRYLKGSESPNGVPG
jgi:uncharacterized protein (TIGR00369 family)